MSTAARLSSSGLSRQWSMCLSGALFPGVRLILWGIMVSSLWGHGFIWVSRYIRGAQLFNIRLRFFFDSRVFLAVSRLSLVFPWIIQTDHVSFRGLLSPLGGSISSHRGSHLPLGAYTFGTHIVHLFIFPNVPLRTHIILLKLTFFYQGSDASLGNHSFWGDLDLPLRTHSFL